MYNNETNRPKLELSEMGPTPLGTHEDKYKTVQNFKKADLSGQNVSAMDMTGGLSFYT